MHGTLTLYVQVPSDPRTVRFSWLKDNISGPRHGGDRSRGVLFLNAQLRLSPRG
jgi:hypothetical protein